jgi:hypothetical protein
MDPYGLTLLTKKYAELAEQAQAHDKEARTIRAAMTHLAASIRLIQDGHQNAYFQPRNPYKHNPHVKRGTYARVAADVLRDAGKPLPAREICVIALRRHGAVDPDVKLILKMTRAMETCLMKKVKAGILEVDRNCRPKAFFVNQKPTAAIAIAAMPLISGHKPQEAL